MKGTILTITVEGVVTRQEATSPHILSEIEKAVGGFIEGVPYFDQLRMNGATIKCAAFCNEHGKLEGMPVNAAAQSLWVTELERQRIPIDDVLVGPVAIVYGDEEFMAEL
jgi:NADH:ubiquinone oxidoreductase subunit D